MMLCFVRNLLWMNYFAEALVDFGLLEIPMQRPFMTWLCGKGDDMVLERLDRGLVNSCFLDIYPMVIEKHIVKDSSNHIPILFNLYGNKGRVK